MCGERCAIGDAQAPTQQTQESQVLPPNLEIPTGPSELAATDTLPQQNGGVFGLDGAQYSSESGSLSIPVDPNNSELPETYLELPPQPADYQAPLAARTGSPDFGSYEHWLAVMNDSSDVMEDSSTSYKIDPQILQEAIEEYDQAHGPPASISPLPPKSHESASLSESFNATNGSAQAGYVDPIDPYLFEPGNQLLGEPQLSGNLDPHWQNDQSTSFGPSPTTGQSEAQDQVGAFAATQYYYQPTTTATEAAYGFADEGVYQNPDPSLAMDPYY